VANVVAQRGTFGWDAVVPHLALVCLAADPEGNYTNSIPFNLTPGSSRDLGRIVLETGEKAESLHGEKADWRRFRAAAGPELPPDFAGPAVVVFADGTDAVAKLDALEAAHRILDGANVKMILTATGASALSSSTVTILSGPARGVAGAYLVDGAGTIALETNGIPPYSAVRRLANGQPRE
jgi:hypothetical protein